MAYNPGVQFDPGIIERSGSKLMDVITKWGDQRKNEATEATTLRKLAGVYDPENKDRYTTMGLDELRGTAKAFALKQAMQEQQQTQALNTEKLAGLKRAAASESALSRAVQGAGTAVPAIQTPGMFGGDVAPAGKFGAPTRASLSSALMDNPEAILAPDAPQRISTLMEAAGGKAGVMPVPAKIGGRNLIVNPKSGAFQDVTQPEKPTLPPGMEALRVEEDENGSFKIHYGFPKAEGKALTQTEVNNLASLNQAELDLNTLEKIYTDLGPDYGGPVSGRVKSLVMGGQNPNIASLENAITAATPNLARGVFREVGVLTDEDIKRYKALLPAPTDTQEVRKRKIGQLRERISEGKKQMVSALRSAGRDVSGFGSKEEATVKRFDSESAARSAGAKAGDVIELYDPTTASYRKARLK